VSYTVRYAPAARDDLLRLYDHLIERAQVVEDLLIAEQALEAIEAAIASLSRAPFIYRKVSPSPFLRELVISFGHTGFVALYEVEDAQTVTILAVRHQREDDYH
jgi:plasmid stabilization system protein ParE